LLAIFSTNTNAFGITTNTHASSFGAIRGCSSPSMTASSSALKLSSSSTTNSGSSSSYSAMTSDEIEAFLSKIPVYAITVSQQEKENGGGLVMLSEPNNPNNIACFFLNPLHANSVYAPLREKSNIQWDVTAFTLGSIWMDLMKNEFAEDGSGTCVQDQVEYRIVPDPNELLEARNILKGTASEGVFESSYNEIPVFFHDKLRLMGDSGDEKDAVLPMYFSLEDLKNAHDESSSGSAVEDIKNYDSDVRIGELRTLVQQMQSESATDYRRVMLVPSWETAAKPPSSSGEKESKPKEDEGDGETLNLPTTGDWSD